MTLKDYKVAVAKALRGYEGDVRFYVTSPGSKEREVFEIEPVEFESDFYHVDQQTRFRVTLRNKDVTSFRLVEFPGCCAILVSTGASVREEFRDKGINTLSNQLRQEIAKVAGYTAIICTDVVTNEPERRTLGKNGFEDIYFLTNKRTGNKLAVSIKELDK